MNNYFLTLLLALITGTPMLSVNAQSSKSPTEETKNTVITFKGDTLIKKITSTVTTDPLPAEKAWQNYNAAIVVWSDSVQKIAKKHQENPSLGAPVFPPMPKEPSKSSANNIANANTIKKQLILNDFNDTLYYEYKEFDASGRLIKEDVRILDETLKNKRAIKLTTSGIGTSPEIATLPPTNTPPPDAKSESPTPPPVQQKSNIRIVLPENTELEPGYYTIKRNQPTPNKKVIHSLRFYYGLNNAYQMDGNEASLKISNTSLLPVQGNAMPQLKRIGSDHMGLETSWGFNLIKGKIRIFSGLRYDNYDYRFQDPTTVIAANRPMFTNLSLNPTVDPNPEQIESQLSTHYIGFPLAIGLHTQVDNSELTIRAGFTGNYLVHSNFRTRFKDKSKNKVVDDFNLNDFMLMPTVQVEYGDIGVYLSYSSKSIFRANEAFPMRLLTLGISLNLG